MKIVGVGVRTADDELDEAAIAQATALVADGDHLMLFGHAAVVGGLLHRAQRDVCEGVWLDDAGAWWLREHPHGDEGSPPLRPRGGPLASAVAVVPSWVDGLLLQRAERVIDMAGTLLVMMVPNSESIDAIDDANLWLVGGWPFSIVQHGSRAIVVVGDHVVVVSFSGNAARVQAHAFDKTMSEQVINLQTGSCISVQSP